MSCSTLWATCHIQYTPILMAFFVSWALNLTACSRLHECKNRPLPKLFCRVTRDPIHNVTSTINRSSSTEESMTQKGMQWNFERIHIWHWNSLTVTQKRGSLNKKYCMYLKFTLHTQKMKSYNPTTWLNVLEMLEISCYYFHITPLPLKLNLRLFNCI